MSDFESAASTPVPMIHRDRAPKRRRIYHDSEASTPRYSSPDELGDHEPRRTSHVNSRKGSVQRRSRSSDGSADELDHTYQRRRRSRSSSSDTPRSSRSSPSPPPVPLYKPLNLNYKAKLILRGHTKGVSQVRFSPDGRWIASGSADGTIRIWDSTTGEHKRTLEGHLAGVSTIAWSPDSNTIASGADDKVIRLWDRQTGKPYPAPMLGHHNYVYSIAFSPRGNMMASGSYDEAVFIWDLRTRRLMKSLPAHSDPVGGIDFVRDGTLVCSCSTDGLIRVWDTATGQCLRTIVHEDNAPVTTVRFSPNGHFILAWTLDSCIRLWDYVSGTCKKTYQGHVNKKYSLGGAFGVGGSEGYIVSGSEDGDIIFWHARNKEVLQRLSGHEGVVCWVDTCHSKPGFVVSGGLDGTVRVWVDVNGEEDGVRTISGMKLELNGESDEVSAKGRGQNSIDFHDTQREMSVDGARSSNEDAKRDLDEDHNKMEED